MRDELKKLNVPQNKINIIYFGVDTKKVVRKDRTVEILNKFNISNEITIISLRSFEPVYDIKTLILAAKIILKQIPDVHFLLVGRGTLEKELKELVHSLSIDASVHFTGFIDNL